MRKNVVLKQTYTYDAIGNPLTYLDGMSFTWTRGRRLATFNWGSTSASYEYDDSGIRTKKTVDGVTTEYFLNGSTILSQVTDDGSTVTKLDFFIA